MGGVQALMNRIQLHLAMFDLDGTLFDTERASYLAYKEACGAAFPLTEDFFRAHCMSRSYRYFLPLLGVPDGQLKEIHDRKIRVYPNFFDAVHPNETLFALAQMLRQNGIPLAVVTTASRRNTLELLQYFDAVSLFDLLVTQECVERQKPAPDAYLYAMHQFDAIPEQCIIFEDSPTGLEAAKASGAVVYQVVGGSYAV